MDSCKGIKCARFLGCSNSALISLNAFSCFSPSPTCVLSLIIPGLVQFSPINSGYVLKGIALILRMTVCPLFVGDFNFRMASFYLVEVFSIFCDLISEPFRIRSKIRIRILICLYLLYIRHFQVFLILCRLLFGGLLL